MKAEHTDFYIRVCYRQKKFSHIMSLVYRNAKFFSLKTFHIYSIIIHTAELKLVLINPGAKQLTLIFSGPSSTDSALVNPNKAVLLME